MERDVEAQLSAAVEAIRAVLGDGIVAVYLYGSAVSGGLHPRSDLDLLVVTNGTSAADLKRQLVERLSPVSARSMRPAGWRPLEVTLVSRGEISPWRCPPVVDFQFGEWLRADYDAGRIDDARQKNPDVVLLLAMARESGVALLGPPAAEVIDHIPVADMQRAARQVIDSLLTDLDGDTTNVLLTLARIWTTLETGQIRSKDEAAEWAMRRLPADDRPVLEHARAVYLGAEEHWEPLASGVAPFVRRLLGRLPAR